jgi:hypothetical protein
MGWKKCEREEGRERGKMCGVGNTGRERERERGRACEVLEVLG